MAETSAWLSSPGFRQQLVKRGGETAARCYQCATCSAVCELAPEGAPFPRQQVHLAQWGMAGRLAADPGVWLCHQCNDCSTRCPRDAKPGDVLASLRSLTIETLAFPSFIGKLVGRAGSTWPLLVGIPLLFWIVLLFATGFHLPGGSSCASTGTRRSSPTTRSTPCSCRWRPGSCWPP